MRETVLLMAAVSVVFVVAGEAPEETRIELAGLRIVAPAPGRDEAMRPFSMTPGTTVSLLINRPSGGLVQFDHNNSTITKFLDAKGNDLLARPARSDGMIIPAGFSLFPKVSRDGKSCAIEVSAPNTPAKGSAQLTLEGIITVLCASKQTEHVQSNVALKNGEKITAPNLELTLDHVGKPDFGTEAEQFGLTFRSKRDLDDIAEIKFFNAEGKEMKSRRTGTSKMGVLGDMTVEWNYNLEEKLEKATIKLLLWSDLQKKRVTLKLNVDLGL